MNKELKIKLNLDSADAEESLNKIEEQADRIIEKLTGPVVKESNSSREGINVNPGNIRILLQELSRLANKTPGKNINRMDETGIKNFKDGEKEFSMHQKEITDIEKKYSQQRKKIASDESKSKAANLGFLLQTTGAIFGKQAEIYKAISIAEATISAYNAANAALLPPPVGAGPILGEIQAGIVLMNSMKRVERIAASKIPGYARGGIVVGEKGPEVIENMQDYAAGRAELIQKTIFALQNNLLQHSDSADGIIREIKNLRSEINKILERPAVAYLNDREAKRIYYRGSSSARKNR